MRSTLALLSILLVAGAGGALAQSAGDVIVVEVMQNPNAVADSSGEWFEVHNTTGSAIDMTGWTISDNGIDSYNIASSIVVPAHGFAVLCNNSDTGLNGGFTCNHVFSNFFLGNSDDEIVLTAPGPVEIDRVEWDGGPTWPDPTGASMVFIGGAADDNNVGSSWTTATAREASYTGATGDLGSPGTLGSQQSVPVEIMAFSVE